jgi:dihydroorotate dehydrogenase (NAD+) catalytic subunit
MRKIKPNIAVTIGKLKLKNPVMVASGTWGEDYGELADVSKLGAIVAKTITLKARTGNPPPRVAETTAGMLNSIGLENKGVDDFLAAKLPKLERFGVPVIVSIAGEEERELAELARKVKRAAAIELNLSCPNVKHGARAGLIAQDAEATAAMVAAVRQATALPVIAKLTPNVTDIASIAIAAEGAGADAVLVANTLLGMAVDIGTRRPKIGNICGGYSGPAVMPIVLKMVWDTFKKVKIPVIGCGGVMGWQDAIEYFLCGASAVQFGTANFVDPGLAGSAVSGIERYLSAQKARQLADIIGTVRTGV